MMMQEFTDRTGFEPMHDEYKAIEEAYYRFDGNKDEFCTDWMKNGGPEKIAEERAKKIEQLNSRILELDRQLRKTSEQFEKHIADLENKLEREQERLGIAIARMQEAMQRRLLDAENRLEHDRRELELVSPYAVLGRGYAIVQRGPAPVTGVSQLSAQEQVTIRFQDGLAKAVILDTEVSVP